MRTPVYTLWPIIMEMHTYMSKQQLESGAYIGVHIVANCNGNAYIHEQTTIGIGCTSYSQCVWIMENEKGSWEKHTYEFYSR